MKEHDTVRLVSAVHDEGEVFAAGTVGAIIGVYNNGEAFAVELQNSRREPVILRVPAAFLEVVCRVQTLTREVEINRLREDIVSLDAQIREAVVSDMERARELMSRRIGLRAKQVRLSAQRAPASVVAAVEGRATHLVCVERIVKQTSYVWQDADTPAEALEFAKAHRAWLYSEVLETLTTLATLKDAAEHRKRNDE